MIDTYKREYYTEAYRIIMSYGADYISKIPTDLLNSIKTMVLDNYSFEYNPNLSFKEQNVKKEAVSLLAALQLQYWSLPEEKEELKNMIKENEIKHEKEKQEKYSYDNLFKTEEELGVNQENIKEIPLEKQEKTLDLQITKKNSIIYMINKIKEFFKNIFRKKD